jgi:succinate dehydrogenase hydrophobic anchor subunit
MDKKLIKIATYISGAILVIGVIFMLLTMLYGKNFTTDAGVRDRLLNPSFGITLVMLIITALGAVLFPFFSLVKSPKQLIRILAIIAGVVIIAVIAFTLSTNELSPERLQKLNVTAQTSKTVGAGLIFTYFIVAVTFGALIVTNLINMFKK